VPAERSPPPTARHRARVYALQGLYQWMLNAEDAPVIGEYLRQHPEYRKADERHFLALLGGCMREATQLRDRLEPCLDRRVVELSPVEHAILLIGAYEYLHHPEIPYRVVINEAVELAKVFGGTDGYKFVNGVLDKLATQLRPAELHKPATQLRLAERHETLRAPQAPPLGS